MKLKYLVFLFSIFIISMHACKPDDAPDDSTPIVREAPHFYIDVVNNDSIDSKSDYRYADIRIDGKHTFDDYEGKTSIRGRGNSSWQMPKKPYKMKLDSKESLLGMAPYKSWILLNSYLDGTLILESIPFKAGQLLGIPYTNVMEPVELTINGKYQGFYAFTSHKEVGENRIDIGKDGWLLELDSYYDEPLKFKSANYNLPVMIQYPKYKNMTEEEAIATLDEIQTDFEVFETLVHDASFPENNYLDYFDAESYVNYMIVFQLTLNTEINHPKSVYMNKLAGGKYRMGIIWDFDGAFGYRSGESDHFDLSRVNKELFGSDSWMVGAHFLSKFMEDPEIQSLFIERWDWFKRNKYDELKDYITSWAKTISPVLERDHEIWGPRASSGDTDTDLLRILTWLDKRSEYIDRYIAEF